MLIMYMYVSTVSSHTYIPYLKRVVPSVASPISSSADVCAKYFWIEAGLWRQTDQFYYLLENH